MNNKKLVEFGRSLALDVTSSNSFESKNTNKCLTVSEKGKKYILHNDNDSTNAKYHIDGHVIDDNDMKCDYLVVNYFDNNEKLLFIELKGANLTHAFDQISRTIDVLEPYTSKLKNKRYYARIVCSKVASRFNTSSNYVNLKTKIANLNKEKNDKYIKITGSRLEEHTEDL